MALACVVVCLSVLGRWYLGDLPRPWPVSPPRVGAHPLGLTLWQGVIGGMVLLIIMVLRGKRLPLSSRHLLVYAVCGVVGTALPTTLTFTVAPRIPVGVFSIMQAATPLITYLMAIALRIDGIAPTRLAGIVIGFVAVCLLVGPASVSLGPASTMWLLLGLLVSLSYASENNIIAIIRPDGIDDLTLLTGLLLFWRSRKRYPRWSRQTRL